MAMDTTLPAALREWRYALQDEAWIEDNVTHQQLVATRPSQPMFERLSAVLCRASWRSLGDIIR